MGTNYHRTVTSVLTGCLSPGGHPNHSQAYRLRTHCHQYADPIQRFYTAHLNPYLNYHRPCGFAQVLYDERGRRRRRYRTEDYATPYEKLRSLPEAHRYLKDGLRWELLDQFAYALSDTEAARRMMRAKAELLRTCKFESPFPPRLVC